VNKHTYLYWPIRLQWKSAAKHDSRLLSWFAWHGWQVGWKEPAHGLFGWTFHLGRLIVLFGKDMPRKKAEIIPFPKNAA